MNGDSNPPAPAVEAAALTKIYGTGNTEVVAMRDVSLRLEPGEVVAPLGPSGAGKPRCSPRWASSIPPPPAAS